MISEKINTVLVLAPHTDDGEFGCGGTISKLISEGKEVHYVAFSSCEKSVPKQFPKDILITEVKAATKKLGIREENLSILKYDVSVSAVPVPAALFLFAPALLGFLGLRRKTAVAA